MVGAELSPHHRLSLPTLQLRPHIEGCLSDVPGRSSERSRDSTSRRRASSPVQASARKAARSSGPRLEAAWRSLSTSRHRSHFIASSFSMLLGAVLAQELGLSRTLVAPNVPEEASAVFAVHQRNATPSHIGPSCTVALSGRPNALSEVSDPSEQLPTASVSPSRKDFKSFNQPWPAVPAPAHR